MAKFINIDDIKVTETQISGFTMTTEGDYTSNTYDNIVARSVSFQISVHLYTGGNYSQIAFYNNLGYNPTISGLQSGCQYALALSATVILKQQIGENEYKNIECNETGSNNIVFYTHPGPFSWNASNLPNSSNNIINNILTKDRVNAWADHFQKVYHWYNQSGINYNVNLKVIQNEPITAEWMQNCLDAMKAVGKRGSLYNTTVKGISNGYSADEATLITADLINALNFSGT